MSGKSLCGMSADEILDQIGPAGFSMKNVLSVANSIYKKRINSISDLPGLSKKHRIELGKNFIPGIFDPVDVKKSSDGTIKYLFINENAQKYETVFIPGGKRKTVCVSTQSGCRMGCPYCATGKFGYYGNLPVRDILNQILGIPGAGNLTHVVFMGMGEPLDNLENVIKACKIITAEWGPSISPRNVTVSTIGLIREAETFLQSTRCNLTLSLYSPFPGERVNVIPAEKQNPFIRILEIMNSFSCHRKRRLSIAYIMIDGVNDSSEHLNELIKILAGSRIRVNLLPYHPVRDNENRSSSPERMEAFKHGLVTSGISASVRRSRGLDISAACGLLASGLKE
jgi:23S rRNA (adenine2503-C2)-methyltransferase